MSSEEPGSQSGQNWNPSLGDTDVASVLTTLGQVEQQLPFLVGLSRADRQKLAKLGPASRVFVADAVATAQANPGVVPRSVDLATFQSRADTLDNLGEVKRALVQLLEKVTDTEVRLGSEVFGVARAVYAVLKTPATVPGLKDRQDVLARRFARKRSSRPTETTTSGEASS